MTLRLVHSVLTQKAHPWRRGLAGGARRTGRLLACAAGGHKHSLPHPAASPGDTFTWRCRPGRSFSGFSLHISCRGLRHL